jgi:hypothetical protein
MYRSFEGLRLILLPRNQGVVTSGFVPVKFEAILVRVLQGFGEAVVGCAGEGVSGLLEPLENDCKVVPGGIAYCDVEEAGGVSGRGRSVLAEPDVQTDMVVVSPGGDEGGIQAIGGGQFESQESVIKVQRALHVGNLQVYVAYPGVLRNGIAGVHMNRDMEA